MAKQLCLQKPQTSLGSLYSQLLVRRLVLSVKKHLFMISSLKIQTIPLKTSVVLPLPGTDPACGKLRFVKGSAPGREQQILRKAPGRLILCAMEVPPGTFLFSIERGGKSNSWAVQRVLASSEKKHAHCA